MRKTVATESTRWNLGSLAIDSAPKKTPRLQPGREDYVLRDHHKDSASPSAPTSGKPETGAESKVNDPLWSAYLEGDRRTQEELSTAERQIRYLMQGVVRWLLDNPSTEENAHVFELQARLAELDSIIARRAKRSHSPEDGPQWSATVAQVRSLLKKTNIGGEELADQLPKKLFGSDQTESASRPDRASRVAKKLEEPKGNPTMTVNEAAHAFGKSKATIYRWIEEGKLDKSGAPGRVLTESVMRRLKPPSEQ